MQKTHIFKKGVLIPTVFSEVASHKMGLLDESILSSTADLSLNVCMSQSCGLFTKSRIVFLPGIQ